MKLSLRYDADFGDVSGILPDLKKIRQSISRTISQVTLPALIEAEFNSRSGPDGSTWKPAEDGHLPQMERTGKLRGGYKFSAKTNGETVTVSCTNLQAYWWYLQEGTNTIEARKQFPDDGLPDSWADAFEAVVMEQVDKHMRKL